MEEKFLFPLVILVHTQAERKQQTQIQIQIHFKALLTLLEEDLPDKFTLRYKE